MVYRSLLCVLAAGAAAFALAQTPGVDLNKPVTYRTPAVPLQQALDDIAKQLGTQFTADGDLATEPVIVKVDAVSGKEIMDRVAQQCDAEWRSVKGGYELFRSQDMVDKLQQDYVQKRVDRITKSIQKMAGQAKADGRITKEQADMVAGYFIRSGDLLNTGNREVASATERAAMTRRMAETRLLAEILANMDPQEIASLPAGGRYVYAVKPNAVQRQLPEIDADTMKAYVEDQNLISDAVIAKVTQGLGHDPTGLEDSYPHITDLNLKVFVVLQPSLDTDQSIMAMLEVFDSKNNEVGTTAAFLGRATDMDEYRASYAAAQKEAVSKGLECGPAVNAIVASFAGGKTANEPLDPELRAALLTPTEHDPLQVFTSDCVLKIADAESLNTMFVGTDDCESYARTICARGRFTRSLFDTFETQYGGMEISSEGGWYLGKPRSALLADQLHCPRDEMEKLLKAIDERGYLSIDDGVNFVRATNYGVPSGLTPVVRQELWPANGYDWLPGSENLTRFYGSLSDEQRQQASTGTTLTYAQLTGEQRELLYRFVLGDAQMINYTPEAQKSAGPDAWRLLNGERTELLPNGILPGDKVVISDAATDTIFYNFSYKGQPAYPQNGTVDSVANLIAETENPKTFLAGSTVNNFCVGTRRSVTVKVILHEKYQISGEMDEDHKPSGEGVTADKLADILSPRSKQQFLDALAKYRDMLKNARFQEPDQPATPPPAR